MLNYQEFGNAGARPTLLIAHGLFGSGRNWRAIARHFSRDRHVVTVDMRNHGDSFWDDDNSYAAMAGDLHDVINHLGGPIDLIGHSMGGKASMVLALDEPKSINRLLIADIAPVAYTHDQVSNVKIMQALPLDQIKRRSDADAILSNDIDEPAVRAFFLQSLVLSEAANSWQLNLAALAQNMDQIVGFPDVQGTFDHPTLFLRGGVSTYVQDKDIPKIRQHFPKYEIETIEGAGHWLHAEATRAFINATDAFLS